MADGLSWLFFGAGAIGTYIGGSLLLPNRSQTGQQRVVFVERPGVAEEIRRSGLQLNLQGEEYTVPDPKITSSLAEALQMGPFDVAVFALKSFDTAAAIAGYQAHLAELPPFLCLSNGVENETTLQVALGPQRVIAGTVTSAVGRRGKGDIILERLRGIGVAADHSLSERIAAALDSAGLHARLYPDAASMKWSKMLTNLIANASSAILDMTPAEIFAHPGLYNLEIRQQREALAVMSALKLHVVDLPGTPVRLLALGTGLPPALSRPLLSRSVGKGRGNKMPSFHIDLHSGRGQSEVDYLNGAVARFGQKLGIPTPVNSLLNQTLLDMTTGKIPLSEYAHQPKKLLNRL